MDFRTYTIRQALAALGACLGLMLLAGPAAARPAEDAFSRYLANHETHEQRAAAGADVYKATRTGIPDSVVALVERNRAAAEHTVVPYLSHGIGVVDGGSTPQLRERPDGFQPQLHGVQTAAAPRDGFDWETTGFVSGAIVAAMLLALMSTIALRERRGLRSA